MNLQDLYYRNVIIMMSLINICLFLKKFPVSDYAFYDEDEEEIDIENYVDSYDNFRNDKILSKEYLICNFRQFIKDRASLGGVDEITFTGYPSSDDQGTYMCFPVNFAILKTSHNQQQCWDIISDIFLSISTDKNMYENYLPTLKKRFLQTC